MVGDGRKTVVVVDGRKTVVVVDGRKTMVVVDGRKSGQRHPEVRPGGQTGLDNLKAHPHPRVHCPSHASYRGLGHPTCLA